MWKILAHFPLSEGAAKALVLWSFLFALKRFVLLRLVFNERCYVLQPVPHRSPHLDVGQRPCCLEPKKLSGADSERISGLSRC